MTESKRTTLNVQIDGTAINATVSFLSPTNLNLLNAGGMEVVKISATDKFGPKFYEYYRSDKTF
jgi:hypothetical protein